MRLKIGENRILRPSPRCKLALWAWLAAIVATAPASAADIAPEQNRRESYDRVMAIAEYAYLDAFVTNCSASALNDILRDRISALVRPQIPAYLQPVAHRLSGNALRKMTRSECERPVTLATIARLATKHGATP